MQQGFLGDVQCADHPAVLLRQVQAPLLHVQLTDGFEQRRLEFVVLPQFAIKPGEALLHRLVSEQCIPQHRQQAVPARTGDQQQGVAPRMQRLAAPLIRRDHAVDGQDQGRLGDGRVTLAQCAEHDQAKRSYRHAKGEQQGEGEQHLHRRRGDAETQQRDQKSGEPARPAVIGFCQRAGNDAEKQRNGHRRLREVPAQSHAAGQRDQHSQAVAELVHCPESAQRMAERG